MTVPEEIRARLSRWCTDRIPDAERDQHQIGYTTQGDEVTILDRRPPAYPELNTAWSSTPLARLRYGDPAAGTWTLYRPVGERGWQREAVGDDPLALLDAVRE